MASIQKRPNGKYLVRWRNEKNEERSEQRTLMRDARILKAQIETDLSRGDYVDPKAGLVSFREYFDDWKQRQIWTTGTRRTIELVVKTAPFADTSINKIKKSHVEAWVKSMEPTYAANTIHRRFTSVGTIIRAAIGDGLITKDPTIGVRLPRRENSATAMKVPTAEEVRAVLQSADEWFAPFIAVCAFAGLRRGEAAALKLADIDFLGRSISVTRQIQKENGVDPEIRAPKHGSSRVVYVPDDLIVMLSEHVKHVGTYSDKQWLFFGGHRGWPIYPSQAAYRWTQAAKRAGVQGFSLHSMRHFYASGLIASGCDVVTVQRAMGHGSPSITLNTYSHMWPDAADRTRIASGGLMKDVFEAGEDQVRTTAEVT